MDDVLLINAHRVNISHVCLLLIGFSPHVNEKDQVASPDHHQTNANTKRCSGRVASADLNVGPDPCFEPNLRMFEPGELRGNETSSDFSTLGIAVKAFL